MDPKDSAAKRHPEPARAIPAPSRRVRSVALDAVAVGAPLALLYAWTVSRDLGTIDSGELATVCARLLVAHPTGYPLYTLIGRIFVLLWPGTPIQAVVLLSSAAAWVTALLTVWLTRRYLRSLASDFRLARRGEAARPLLAVADGAARGSLTSQWLPWAAGLWIGTNRVFWEQAVGNEVYSLHLCLVALLLLLALRLFDETSRARAIVLAAYVLGLAFGHHLSVTFVLPALGLAAVTAMARLGFFSRGGSSSLFRLLLAACGLAILGWSVVLYLPIRSSTEPILDWGAPHTWSRFWRHVFAAQYRVWFLESVDGFTANLRSYLAALPERLSWPVLILATAGLGNSLRRANRPFVATLLLFVTTLLWASGYEIFDLAPYYLSADLVLVLWGAYGMAFLAHSALAHLGSKTMEGRDGTRTAWLPIVLGVLSLIPALLQGATHFRSNDRRGDRLVRTHAEAVLQSVPEKCILLSRHWDALVSPLLYLERIENRRLDVTVVDTELLRRSWYFPQLRRWDPELLPPIEADVSAFLQDLALFEAGRPYDPSSIEGHYRTVIAGIAHTHRATRPTAFTADVTPQFVPPAVAVPEGLVYVLRDRPEDSPAIAPPDPARLLNSGVRPDDRIHHQVLDLWNRMLAARISFLREQHREAEVGPWEAALRELGAIGVGIESGTRGDAGSQENRGGGNR